MTGSVAAGLSDPCFSVLATQPHKIGPRVRRKGLGLELSSLSASERKIFL